MKAVAALGSWEWDLDADRVTWSDGLYRMFHLAPQSAHGGLDVFLSLLDPSERDAAARSVRAASASGAIFAFDHTVHLPDGDVRILESRGQLLAEGAGSPRRMVGTVQDVTDARRASQKLPSAEYRLRQSTADLRRQEQLIGLLDAVAAAANLADSFAGVIADAMQLIAEATGWSLGHALTRGSESGQLTPLDLRLHADDDSPLIGASEQTLGWGDGLPGRVWAAGRAAWIGDVTSDPDFRGSAAIVASGLRGAVAFPVLVGAEVGAVIVFFTPTEESPPVDVLQTLEHVGTELGRVLERERAARALAAHERRFRTVVEDGSDVVVVILDPAGVVRYLSPPATRVFSIAESESSLDTWSRIHPEDAHRVRTELAELKLTARGRRRFEFRAHGIDDDWRHLDTVATNLIDDPDVNGIVLHCRDVTEQRLAESRLEHQRLHDPLTGCSNRSLFTTHLQRALSREVRSRRGVAVFAVDLDRFQSMNEQYGYDVGDAVLVAVADRIRGALRAYDTVARPGPIVARLGGDEFLALCEDVGSDVSVAAIGRRLAIAVAEPVVVDGREIAVTATVGVAVSRGGEMDADSLLAQAEAAVRRAKTDLATTVELFDEEGQNAAQLHDHEVAALREAIALGQLRLHYQPKVDIGSGRLQGVEALVRWEHSTRGMVPPVEFIALAEQSGLIGSLGEWVLTESCRQQASWAAQLGPNAPRMVSVNVSGHQLVPGFVDLVRRTIADTGVLPEMVCVEITESVAMRDVDAAVGIVQELKALGLVVSIDDFGTGYSSLSQLKRFPIDELKIDKSFIDGMGTDPGDTAIVAAIVAMAHALGLLVIAEGVETIDQLKRLRSLGCEMAQGYLFSRPLAPEALVALGSVLRPVADGSPSSARRPAAEVVLVVDDTDDVRQLAKVSLATSGFEVLEAVSGDEALREARRARPACIVLDVSMPGMNGFDACRALRSDPFTSSAAIVMLTSRADADDKVQAFSAGADDYMVKPFAPRELVSRVRQAIIHRAAAP